MVRRRPASAPSNGASAKPRRSERIEKQQVAAKSESSTTTQESAPSPSKRKRGNAQLKTTKASARNKPVAKEKTAKKKSAKNAATRSKQNQKYRSLKSRDNAAEEFPHNLGSVPSSIPAKIGAALEPTNSDKENRALSDDNVSSVAADLQATIATAAPKKRKANRPAYRLTPGITPYPDLPHPTAEECEEVNRLLSEVHGEVIPPATIPEPSLTITGCGEVPSVLDALIRTLLSGATSGNNSALAFDGLVKRFGILKEGIGKGSVNWDAVRQAPLEDVFEAIKRGGLAAIKSKSLKAILDKVYEENQAQRDRLKANDESNDDKDPSASSQKEYEIACAEQHVLSLNHLHTLSTEEVMTELVKYPGIGPKTAACVILFCLQRPCFAVDTHIFRICKWLGWVPLNATEIMAFSHLEVRIPGHLKYSLHQLFIRHGKSCPRCRAITGEKSAGWDEGCIIEHLVQRTGIRKGGAPVPSKGKQSTRSRKRKRDTAAKKKQTKAKGSRKKVTPATRKSTRSTRKTTAKEESTSTTTDATDDSSSSSAAVDKDASSSDAETPEAVSLILPSHAPVSDETSTHTTPTPEKDNAIESARFENGEHKISPVSAIEEDASTRKASPELEATKSVERENIPSHEIKKYTSEDKGEIAKDPEDAE